MLNDPAHTALLDHDPHGRGPRGGLDPTQKRAHPPDPTAASAPHNNHPTPAIPTKNPTLKHKPTQTAQLGQRSTERLSVAGLENLPRRPDEVNDVDGGPDAQRGEDPCGQTDGEEPVRHPRGGCRCDE